MLLAYHLCVLSGNAGINACQVTNPYAVFRTRRHPDVAELPILEQASFHHVTTRYHLL